MSHITQLPSATAEVEVALLTGGIDKPYAFGLAMALVSRGVQLDFIGSDELDSPELRAQPRLTFLNLRGDQRDDVGLKARTRRILIYYARLVRYAVISRRQIFHILWNNKFEMFDRTLLMLHYRMLRKRVVLTAHNVNSGRRDFNDSFLNRLTLRMQYRLADHIFVHTEQMKAELVDDFGIKKRAVTVVPLGINNVAPQTTLTASAARRRLGFADNERTLLFFGAIGPYKGLEYLVAAFQTVARGDSRYRLMIVGKPKVGTEGYLCEIQRAIRQDATGDRVVQRLEFVPDQETEMYFKAADVVVLPYREVSQSGVLVLGYSFGLPVIATDVGALKDGVVEGETGFVCRPGDASDLARAIETYFESALFKNLNGHREGIRDFARRKYSWDVVGDKTLPVYARLASR